MVVTYIFQNASVLRQLVLKSRCRPSLSYWCRVYWHAKVNFLQNETKLSLAVPTFSYQGHVRSLSGTNPPDCPSRETGALSVDQYIDTLPSG